MKTTLYYFSGTGNTLYLAQRLADELGECELISISTAMKENKISATTENVGILFPVYCFGTPNIIKEFITKLNVSDSAYLFAAVSFGGLLSRALPIFRRECKKAGLKLNAGFGVQMPGNAVSTYDLIPEEKQKEFAQLFEQRIPEIASAVKGRIINKPETRQLFFQPLMSMLHPVFMKGIAKGAKEYHTTAQCQLCGECVKMCPVGNISIEEKQVLWGEKCEQCMACIQWCSREAIQIGDKTADRKRYHHPCISKKDIQVQG